MTFWWQYVPDPVWWGIAAAMAISSFGGWALLLVWFLTAEGKPEEEKNEQA
jgi:hypothetical protein